MWNIANRMGLRSHPVTPLQKQGFHTIIPIMTGLPNLPVISDKKFTNPNYVNPKNPSVLGYDTFKTVQYHNNPIEIDVKPQHNRIYQPEIIHEKNSSAVLLQKSTEQINSLPEKEVEEEKSVGKKLSTQPVSMCIGTRKRRRKNRRNRRKQRDNPKNPGKHCKNLDKEQKHSKIAEQQQIIKEELEIECDDITMMSCQSAVDNALDNSENSLENLRNHDHFLQLSDFIPKVTENEDIITETTLQPSEENPEIKSELEDWESMSEDEEQTVEDGEYSDVDEVDNVMCFTISFNPNCQRKIRQISVTESEDSFIVFDSGTEEESDFFEDDDEESDTENVETENEETDSDFTSSSSVIPSKKVRFADDSVLCSVKPMIKWAYAYQSARKGPWEEYARDRERFRKRISDTERVLSTVFQPEHRKKVFDERFTAPTIDVPMEI